MKKDHRHLPHSATIEVTINVYIVVAKRAALLFDQLMIALQKVVDSQARAEFENNKALARSAMQRPNSLDAQTMDLQRRGQAKGRVYWRCYFNAVTCFKKK
ncbi:uncharacterized protein V1478_017370 [Vespula squamosa]|uniref:Uncharacterized protein n=1 Tax=Vespula squamosa TaxID=30214 RepID=A0ABD1ZXS7_VESSQ